MSSGAGITRIIIALLLMTDVAMAQMQQRTYQDASGRTLGRSVTDTKGNTVFYDAFGRQTARSVTGGSSTTIYDQLGRQTGSIRK